MNMRRWVPILIGLVLIAFTVGIFSLIYNDNFSINNMGTGHFIRVVDRDEMVRIGPDGIEVKDGDSHVSISWKGIKVRDGNDLVDISWNGIRVNEGDKSRVNIGGNWPLFSNKNVNLIWETVDVEEFLDITGVDNINVSTPFVDVKVTEQDREDVRVHYYGSMRTNIVPKYKFQKKPGGIIDIKIDLDNIDRYAVSDSDVVLEIFIPKVFEGNIRSSTSSGDIYMKNIDGNEFNISSTSGNLELENLEGKIFHISTTSGDIEMEDSIGEIWISSTSGDISLDNENSNHDVKISTVSGDVSIGLSDGASYVIKGDTTSGEFTTSVRMDMETNSSRGKRFRALVGAGHNSMEINTVSGDVHFGK